jgi:hypothetical protein
MSGEMLKVSLPPQNLGYAATLTGDLHPARTKVAWAGVVLSIILPIVVCQFLYMPLVAVRKWHTVTWTSSLSSEPTFPGVVVWMFDKFNTSHLENLTPWACSTITSGYMEPHCSMSDVQYDYYPGEPTWHFIWSPQDQSIGLPAAAKLYEESGLRIAAHFNGKLSPI